MARTSNRTKGGRRRILTNLEIRRNAFDQLPESRRTGYKRPGSHKK